MKYESERDRMARENQMIKDHIGMGEGAEYMEDRLSIHLDFALFMGIEILVFMLLYDHFTKWYYPALIGLIPAILVPVLIEVIKRRRRGY